MSGGSYNYAYTAANDRAVIFEHIADFDAIAARLERTGYAEAAGHVRNWLGLIDTFLSEIERNGQALQPLFEAVEMCDSFDWAEDSVERAALDLSWKKADE